MTAALLYLLSAVRKARHASARTHEMVRAAIARVLALLAIQRCAA